MNTPLVLFTRRLPRELIGIIQSYLRNDVAHDAVYNYIRYVEYSQDLYDAFVYDTYVLPNCVCHSMPRRLFTKYGGCYDCRLFEGDYYKMSQYITCLYDNEQLDKILDDD
jgi:hypothetical protein